ncbi:hypothetical protein VQL36_12975 [Chengkuizengella sp. SCS-71B]|uniref:hypothetical protein n=1 Tax=Chengkuizengella sp. SCS-71B TaxID=3115290 RepID=UPI0032C234A4
MNKKIILSSIAVIVIAISGYLYVDHKMVNTVEGSVIKTTVEKPAEELQDYTTLPIQRGSAYNVPWELDMLTEEVDLVMEVIPTEKRKNIFDPDAFGNGMTN